MPERHGCSIASNAGQVQQIVQHLSPLLTAQELRSTQVLFIQGDEQPQLHDFSDMMSLSQFISFSQSDWLVDMLNEQRLISHFQPIVEMRDTSRIYGYEALLRGQDLQGNLVMPGVLFESATDAGLMPQLDRAARLSAIAAAHQHNIRARLFINFMPTAVYDPVACLRSTVEAIDAAGIQHNHVIFEVVESSHPQEVEHLQSVLKYYREAGFLVALDDLGSGFSSLNLLHQLRPDIVKLDRELVRDVHQDSYKASITEKILEIAQNLGIETVAEGIELSEELDWLRERGATYAQGYLIGKPAASPVQTTPYFVPQPVPQIQVAQLYQQLQQSNQELRRLVSLDSLTQVANRRCFDDVLSVEWQRSLREQTPLSLIMGDVDCFKLFNDTYGHLAGDDVLRQVAQTIARAVKYSSDLVARYGGEEFAIILPNTDEDGALTVAQNIQQAIHLLQIPHARSHVSKHITLSLGTSTIVPQMHQGVSDLIMAADRSLYQAKAQGRKQIVQVLLSTPAEVCRVAS